MKTSFLREVAEIIDSLHQTPKYSISGYPMVRVVDVKYGILNLSETKKVNETVYSEFSRRYKPEVDDIIITRVGSYGISALVKDTEFCLGQNTAALKPKINKRYLYYVLNSPTLKKEIEYSTVGSTQKTLSLKAIGNLQIPRFDERTEQLIGETLFLIDNKIQNNLSMNETLQEMAMSIFKSWFVDFDPVHSKYTGNKPINMDGNTAEMFPNSFGSDGLPIGWKEISFGKLVQPKRGKVITKKKTLSGEFPVVAGGIKPAYYHNEYNAKSPVVTISASGNAGFVNIYHSNIWASDCSFINNEITKYVYFSYCFLKTSQKKLFDMQHGAVQQHIYPKDIMRLNIKVGSSQILDIFEKKVSHLYEKIASNIKENQTLTDLRDTLLPRLLAGKIYLKDAELAAENNR